MSEELTPDDTPKLGEGSEKASTFIQSLSCDVNIRLNYRCAPGGYIVSKGDTVTFSFANGESCDFIVADIASDVGALSLSLVPVVEGE